MTERRALPRSERLEFRRWTLDDSQTAASLWSDPAVMRLLGGPYDRSQVDARLEREIAHDAAHGVQYWPLFLKTTSKFIGCCGLKPYRPEEGFFELGFHLLPPFWGLGYAGEAARAVVDFAFLELSHKALFAGHHPQNEASRRLLQGLQFIEIGTHFFAPTGLQHPWYRKDAPVR